MFRVKSIFFKYIATFIFINLISFAILSTTITAIVESYGNDVKTKTLSNAANSAAMFIEKDFNDTYDDFEEYTKGESRDLKLVLDLLATNDESLLIFVVDSDGRVVHSGGTSKSDIYVEANSNKNGDAVIDESVKLLLEEGKSVNSTDTMNGFFKDIHAYYAIPLFTDGEYIGSVFACSSETDTDALILTMNRTVLMSVLWITLACLVAVYFISERLTAPLKEMSRAVKSFAAGQFDARIEVVGRDEIAELAVAFNNMASSLQTNEDLRRTFLANVSHDLRTPMTTISGFIDGIIDGAIPPEQHEYYLGVIATEVRRLSRLVSQLLDISRLEAGERQFNMQPYDICEQAREIIIGNIQRLEDKNLDVEFVCDNDNMMVEADKDAIHQIFYNICDNAIKFSRDGGKYKIAIHEVKDRNKHIKISVYNEGQGIPKEDLPYVFDRFYKSDKSRGIDKTGVGLGLYIARTIIEAHKQKIWVESEEGKWCKFTFTLPQSAPKQGGILERFRGETYNDN